MENTFYVYGHFFSDTNLPFYIGKGKGNRYKSTSSRNKFWKNVTNKYHYYTEIIEDNLTEQQSFDLEVKLIKQFGKRIDDTGILVNLSDGGEGTSGYNHTEEAREKLRKFRHSEETKMKMSENRIGDKNNFYNKKHSIITKEIISNTHKDKPKSDEHKNKIREANKDFKHTEQAKQEMSMYQRNKNKQKVSMYKDNILIENFDSQYDAAKYLKVTPSVIIACCNGGRMKKVKNEYKLTYSTIKGYTFKSH